MASKFLNKKGWHTGSLRNIENVWKAEQKRDGEQKKLEELRKQIQEERERSEFRLLQEQAGLVPKQERLDFLYDSGLAVGKGSSDGFKALEALPKTQTDTTSCSSSKATVPGALFEDKPQSANDAWRKLHSDPLLLIRQREQEAFARVKNNPIQMAMIRKSVEENKDKGKIHRKLERKKMHKDERSKDEKRSSWKDRMESEKASSDEDERVSSHDKNSKGEKRSQKGWSQSEHASDERVEKGKCGHHKTLKHEVHSSKGLSSSEAPMRKKEKRRKSSDRNHPKLKHEKQIPKEPSVFGHASREYRSHQADDGHKSPDPIRRPKTNSTEIGAPTALCWQRSSGKHLKPAPKLSEEERAARLQEMQMDAQLHEEQRWKRLKKASEDDAREVRQVGTSAGQSFLDVAQKSVYGADKGGSSTIEESVRRRTYYLQKQSEAVECNAFRR
ncbi:pre-mRNA-splicing factor CWC25 homolog isoform X2 [Macadamia integrifolia]|uniref:pre-mRNA-splicing factor CWC25 homolog isoform X2 n=1 Tax=Macadamia integrifolia TaxID=60698 RepID=UPI001C4E9C9A|nr:pre-mRNA-splicing factor CWC25 homolog isoform X2 [Macadamia integrifolia]